MRRSHESLRGHRPIPSFQCSSRSHINASSCLRHGHRHRAARIACPKQSKLYLSSRVRPQVDTSGFERAYVLKEATRSCRFSKSPAAQFDSAVTSVATSRIRLETLALFRLKFVAKRCRDNILPETGGTFVYLLLKDVEKMSTVER